ncbi:nucleoside diphosphate kinase, partial [Jimgerdemannia flammicorona]
TIFRNYLTRKFFVFKCSLHLITLHSPKQPLQYQLSSMSERTYIMVKPDGVERGLVGEIIKRFEQKGYQLLALELFHPTKELLEEHYSEHKHRDFFHGMVTYMLSGPVVGMVWAGKDAVKTGRRILGETNPLASAPGTIRGDFAIEVGRNICHGSDAVESAEKEIALWFPRGVKAYNRAHSTHQLIYEH